MPLADRVALHEMSHRYCWSSESGDLSARRERCGDQVVPDASHALKLFLPLRQDPTAHPSRVVVWWKADRAGGDDRETEIVVGKPAHGFEEVQLRKVCHDWVAL